MNPESNTNSTVKSFFTANVIGAIIIGLILGFLIGVYYGKSSYKEEGDMTMINGDSASTTSALTVNTNNTAAAVATVKAPQNVSSNTSIPTKNEVSVSDIMPGNTVVLNSIALTNTYWVAVRDNSGDVKNPYILGAKRLQAGASKNVLISLSRNTKPNTKYEIVLYKNIGSGFDYSAGNFAGTLGTFSTK